MLARYYQLTNLFPDQYNNHMVSMGGFSNQYLLPAAFRTAHPKAITYENFLTRDNPEMISKASGYLTVGRPVPARVDFVPSTIAWEQHWVLLVEEVGEDYVIVDPWTGRVGFLSEVYDVVGIDVLEAIFYKLKEN
jgi:hypothetical protein